MTEQELKEAAFNITGGDLSNLSDDQLMRLITVTQYVTDLCLNLIEKRGKLTFFDGDPIVPYISDYGVETILTRP